MSTDTPRPDRVTLSDDDPLAALERLLAWPVGRPTNGVDRLIPADELRAAIADAREDLAAREQAPREEIARLSRWKEEALPVLDGLQELGRALGLPLGERVTGPAALAAVEELQAALDRVRRLHSRKPGTSRPATGALVAVTVSRAPRSAPSEAVPDDHPALRPSP